MTSDAPPAGPVPTLNIPNLITLSRLALTFVVLTLIYLQRVWIASTVIFVIAVLTDFLDGYLARRWNQVTPLGRIMDPFVDKIIIGGALIFLTAIPGSGVDPWICFIVIAREIFITALRSVLEGHGVDFSAKFSGKLKMLLQCIAVPACLLSLSPAVEDRLGASFARLVLFRDVLLWGMVVITLYSGAEYVWRGWRMMMAPQQPAKS
jgi:CDP-diacylglycerol--glycerol-3-phosphate 3-phosphatidyltransferase